MQHPFRFGVQCADLPSGNDGEGASGWAARVRRLESLGFSTLFCPDHFSKQWDPTVLLTAAAAVTTRLHVGIARLRRRLPAPAGLREAGGDAAPRLGRAARVRDRGGLDGDRLPAHRARLRHARHAHRAARGGGPDRARQLEPEEVLVPRQALPDRRRLEGSAASEGRATEAPDRRRRQAAALRRRSLRRHRRAEPVAARGPHHARDPGRPDARARAREDRLGACGRREGGA